MLTGTALPPIRSSCREQQIEEFSKGQIITFPTLWFQANTGNGVIYKLNTTTSSLEDVGQLHEN